MRLLYFIFWFGLGFSFRLFFRRIAAVRPNPNRFGRTIFVSNHPSAFLDPLLIASARKPVVYFMTRSDVFNWFTKPLFWLAQMIPIYRAQDGGNSQEKNKKVFKKATETLAKNRNLLIFGEGLTDDVFERKLKPIKKGAIRIGFTALEDLDWKYPISVQGLGINYTNPGVLRSEVLISAAEPMVLNDFKEAYLENPNRVITELNRELENRMQQQITHLHNKEDMRLHEHLMMLSRKGMHVHCYDSNLSLFERWSYSQNLAAFIEQSNAQIKEDLHVLGQEIEGYIQDLERHKLSEAELYWFAIEPNWRIRTFLKLLIQFPCFLLGLIPVGIPFWGVKKFVERKMKRPVFWSSTKMAMLLVLIPIWTLILLQIASSYFQLNLWVWLSVVLGMNVISLGFYLFIKNFKLLVKSAKFNAQKLNTIVNHRETLVGKLDLFQF